MVAVQETPIDLAALVGAVATDASGGIVTFTGTVRDRNAGRKVERLEYHAYPEMAERELARLETEARERFGVHGIALAHRTGNLLVGDVAVAVVVAGAHRAEAFDAARWLIDTLKTTVPIWKKEFFEDGEVWVGLGP